MIDISRYYIPHIKAAFLPRNLPLANKIQLFLGTMQTVKKLVYAFIFQEGREEMIKCWCVSVSQFSCWTETFESDIITSPAANQAGAFLQSSVNFKLGLPTSLPNLGGNLGRGLGDYIYHMY